MSLLLSSVIDSHKNGFDSAQSLAALNDPDIFAAHCEAER